MLGQFKPLGKIKMISEKDKMIVDAVNWFEAEIANAELYHSMLDNVIIPTDSGYSTRNIEDGSRHIVCTIKEFNKCIEEMSVAKWLQKPIEDLVLIARESAKTVNFQYHHFIKNDVSEFPIESDGESSARKEAETKAAKQRQLDIITDKYYNHIARGESAYSLFKKMQESGDLPEPKEVYKND